MKARRFISLVMSAVICMTMAVCMMPKDVKAEDPYVKVGYEDVSTGYGTPTESKTDPKSYTGSVTYNNRTLTLNGVTVPGGGTTTVNGVYSIIDLTVSILGTNSLGAYSNGMSANEGCSLTLSGEGTLNAAGMDFYGIKAGGNLTISGGTINATGKINGLYATGGITITGGSVTAKATGEGCTAFSKQPDFGESKWYMWRTSQYGAFTSSLQTPYTSYATDKYVEIRPLLTPASITTTSLAGGTVGTAYTQTLAATGDATITWGISSGTLPTGLVLNENTGIISGTPSASGTSSFTVKASNGVSPDATKQLSIDISAAPPTKYTATINHGSGTGSYGEGEEVTITAETAPTGKVFDQWEVNSGNVTINQAGNSSTSFTMPAEAVEITATYRDEGGEYDITAGGDQSRDQNKGDSGSGVTITCSGALSELFSILMDGNVVDNSNYSVESGSTILTFKPAYLNTLSVGRHTVTFVYNGNKTASTTLTIKGPVEDTNKQQGKVCDHTYEWVEDEAATATTDAKLVYKCTKCGHIDMRMTEANSAYLKFNQDTEKKINEASSGATVKIDTTRWNSFYRSVIDKLAARTDVTLVIEYTDAGARHQITIPAGTDLTDFIDANGYTGFDFLVSKGLGTDYWAGRLTK